MGSADCHTVFKREGFRLAYRIDLDPVCRHAFEKNNKAVFLEKDVTKVSGEWLEKQFHSDAEARILVGCTPCQHFSPYNRMEEYLRYALVPVSHIMGDKRMVGNLFA